MTRSPEHICACRSGHDVSVAPVLASLSARGWDPYAGDLWPGYASAVRLELVCDDGEAGGIGARDGEASVPLAERGQLDVDTGKCYVRAFYFPGFHLGNARSEAEADDGAFLESIAWERVKMEGEDSERGAVSLAAFLDGGKWAGAPGCPYV